jgi:DNA-binding transcriptional LysR family regulator
MKQAPTVDEIQRIEHRLSLHDLRVLMVVAQAGSMSGAAKLLATSQPAVSRSIGELEHALGVRLLDRSAKGIEPTPFGRALLKRGTAIFDELSHGIKDIRFLSDATHGEVTIGASIAIAEGLVANVITRISKTHPRLAFQVHATDTATAYRALLDRRVDLAIVHIIDTPAGDLMDVEPLLDDPHVVVAGAHNPLARRRKLGLTQLTEEPWVLPLPDQPYGTVVFEAFRAHGLQVPPTVVGSTLPLRTTLLVTGPFLSMVPRVVMQFPPKNRLLKTLPIELPGTARPLALITLKNRTLNPLAHLFADYVRAATKPLRRT